jgi:cytochrome P450
MSRLPPGPGLRGTADFVARASRGGLLPFFVELATRYGPVSSFPLGPQRIVLVDEPALVEEILVTRQHEFVRDTGATLLRELVGEGLLTTDDPAHLARRRLMQPAFHRARVARYAETIVAETDRVVASWPGRETFDVGAEMASLALAAVGAALFGADVRDRARDVADVLAGVARRGGAFAALLAVAGPLVGPLRRAFPTRASLLFPRERARLEALVAPLVTRDRAQPGDDLLSLLVGARDDAGGALGDDAVRDEACMLVLAGHETTANALTWAWYALAEHPAVERRLHAELDAVLAGRAPTADDLRALPYTAAVLDETLRLYPPATVFARRPRAAFELGGYAIPAGASVFVSPFVTQRNPRFFRDPLAFRPERWTEPAPPRFAFFPFGGGSKMCIGEPFARLEATLALARIASRRALRRVERGPIGPAPQVLLRPARPVLVRATAR